MGELERTQPRRIAHRVARRALNHAGVTIQRTHRSRGLKPLEPGEESEDEEILNKTDLEEYNERQPVGARDAMNAMRGKINEQKTGEQALLEPGVTV